MDDNEKYFVKQCKGMSAIEILNWYRNFYHAENHGTERRIVSDAINEIIVKIGGSQ